MTREGAIGNLIHAIRWNDMPKKEALDMAIQALKQEPICPSHGVDCEDCPAYKPQEPCDDAISRQAAIIALDDRMSSLDNVDMQIAMGFAKGIIYDLPPVTPQPKTGHWIPVTERLPEAGEYIGDVAKYYLVQNEYGDMLVARYTHSKYWEQIYQLKPVGDEIVAWLPLPEPYKADKESEE